MFCLKLNFPSTVDFRSKKLGPEQTSAKNLETDSDSVNLDMKYRTFLANSISF